MASQKTILLNFHLLCLFTIFGMNLSLGYPVDKLTVDLPEPELKDETRYDNGTVVGKYTYTDNEGNPIHVKYYADDGSYGVELKSIRVLDSTTEEPSWQSSNFDTLKSIEPLLGTSEFISLSNSDKKKVDYKSKNFKINPYKLAKSADYETFYQNEIKAPRQCESETGKVRVYLDKEKRIIKRALDNYQAAKYCGRL